MSPLTPYTNRATTYSVALFVSVACFELCAGFPPPVARTLGLAAGELVAGTHQGKRNQGQEDDQRQVAVARAGHPRGGSSAGRAAGSPTRRAAGRPTRRAAGSPTRRAAGRPTRRAAGRPTRRATCCGAAAS